MEWELIDEHIITARIDAKIQKILITIIQCYAPTNSADVSDKEEFTTNFKMGDLNAKVGSDGGPKCKGWEKQCYY